MASLILQPLELGDFSGGLTDNFLKGGPTRFAAAENFLLTVDHKLEQRNGSIIFDATYYRLPDNSRVAGLYVAINDSVLLAHNSRAIYDSVNLGSILGASGNPALGEGDVYNNASFSEWQRQVFVTGDQSTSTFPSLLFRDTSNAWKAVTAGLPRAFGAPTYTSVSLLNACIALANDIRATMILHMEDSDPGHVHPSPYLHTYVDKYSLSYLKAEAFVATDPQYPGISPAPTPAPAATDQASLFTLVGALSLAYKNHSPDDFPINVLSSSSRSTTLYHLNVLSVAHTSGPNAALTSYMAPTTLAQAATQLDDLYTKWRWHQLGVNNHSFTNDYYAISKYLVTASKIGTVQLTTGSPYISPYYTDLYNYANNLVRMYNAHARSGGGLQAYDASNFADIIDNHAQPDVFGSSDSTVTFSINLPSNFAVDYESFALAIYWVRSLYSAHQRDSQKVATDVALTFDTVAGSANIATATHALTAGKYIYTPTTFNGSTGYQDIAKITVGGATTATLDKTAINTQVGETGVLSSSAFHSARIPGSADAPVAGETLANGDDAVATTYPTWLSLGTEFFNSFVAHRDNADTHPTTNAASAWSNYLQAFSFFIPTTETHAYAFTYSFNYTVEPNGVEYRMESNPVFSDSISAPPAWPPNSTIPVVPSTKYNSLLVTGDQFSNEGATITLPKIVNDNSTNYGTGSILLNIYKTTDGGNVYRLVASVANGTANYHDQSNDTISNPSGLGALQTQAELYTTGGIVAYDQAPISRFLHILNGVALYGYVTDTNQVFPNRIRQGTPDSPYSSPATFTDDFESEIVGISSARQSFIVLCKNSIYRVTGLFTNTGQGGLTHEGISDTLGCISGRSIVKTEVGVFFAGTDGFYYTDGFQLIKISLELNKTYQQNTQSVAQKLRINGTYDRLNRRIYWNMQENPTDVECNRTFVFYLDYGIKPSGVFTSLSSTTNWQPSSMAFFQGGMIRGDYRGYLLKEDANTKTDPVIDTANTPDVWLKAYMPFDWTSCALDFGSERFRKWVPKVHVVGKNRGNQSIQVNSINDNSQNVPQDNVDGLVGIFASAPINYTANPTWGQPNPVWGSSTYNWKYDGKNDVWRRIAAGGMRSGYRQFQLTNLYGGIYKYDDFPEFSFAAINATTKTATLSPAIGYTSSTWPLDIVGMNIAFNADNFTQEYPITNLDATHKIITYSDSGNLSVTNTQATWVIRGYRKENRISITSVTPWFALIGSEFQSYTQAESGENSS